MSALRKYSLLVIALGVVALVHPVFALQEMSDDSLSDVSGTGVAVDVQLGEANIGYIQIIDDDGADFQDPQNGTRIYGDGTSGVCGTTGGPGEDAAAAASNCGAMWMSGNIFGDYYLEMDTGQAQLDVSDAQTGVDCSGGESPTCTSVPALSVIMEITDYSLDVEIVTGYDVDVGSSGGQGWWGDARLTNFENARLEMNLLFYSPRNADENYRIAGTGVYFEDITIPDEFVFDYEYKDQDLTGSDSSDPGNASYYNNRFQIIDISPTKGDVVFEGMTMEFDTTDGIVVDFPTLKGSFQFGDEGDTSGGMQLSGQQWTRVLFDEWNFDLGILKIQAH